MRRAGEGHSLYGLGLVDGHAYVRAYVSEGSSVGHVKFYYTVLPQDGENSLSISLPKLTAAEAYRLAVAITAAADEANAFTVELAGGAA